MDGIFLEFRAEMQLKLKEQNVDEDQRIVSVLLKIDDQNIKT